MTTSHLLSTELTVLCWSTVLFVFHLLLQGLTNIRERGLRFNAGPRDDAKPLGPLAGRAQRTLDNFKETYPVFVALALGLAISGRGGGIGDAGAWMWFAARIVYIPLYVFGVLWLRSLCWAASFLGLILMFARLI